MNQPAFQRMEVRNSATFRSIGWHGANQQRSLHKPRPRLSEQGESRPVHQPKPTRVRNYHTWPDRFEGDWTNICEWLQKEPDATKSSLLERLQTANAEKYADDNNLRTLQRRIGQWRCLIAKQLVVGAHSRCCHWPASLRSADQWQHSFYVRDFGNIRR